MIKNILSNKFSFQKITNLIKSNSILLIKTKHLHSNEYSTIQSPKDIIPKVVFFGTDILSIQILFGLVNLRKQNLIKEIKVITNSKPLDPEKKILLQNETEIDLKDFKGNQIIEYCSNNNIAYHVWSKVKQDKNFEALFSGFHVGVVASFGHLIPSSVINIFP